MKVITKVVIDMNTMETLEEESYEYEGPVAQCGGSGGGSSSISYPAAMEQTLMNWAVGAPVWPGGIDLTLSIVEALNTAQAANNPYYSAIAFNPNTIIAAISAKESVMLSPAAVDVADYDFMATAKWVAALALRDTYFDALVLEAVTLDAATDIATDFEVPTPAAEAEIATSVAAHGAILDDQVNNEVLPEFQSGMRDINAIVGNSAYVNGEAILWAMRDRDLSDYQGKLRSSAFLQKDSILANNTDRKNILIGEAHIAHDRLDVQNKADRNLLIAREIETNNRATVEIVRGDLEAKGSIADQMNSYIHTYTDLKRIEYVMNKEYVDRNLEIDVSDARWDLSLYQQAANLLASISGGTAVPLPEKPDPGQSALGGAMAGAAIGTRIKPGWGTAIGAAVGAVAGYAAAR